MISIFDNSKKTFYVAITKSHFQLYMFSLRIVE